MAGKGRPQDGIAGPQAGKGQPQDGKAGPQAGKGQPQDGKAGPQAGKGQPQDGKAGPQAGKGQPQDGKAGPQGGTVITVMGNLSIDRIDGGSPTPGGCPAFALAALLALGTPGRIVARAAPAHMELFSSVIDNGEVPVTVLPAAHTSAFALDYQTDSRTLTVQAIGPTWTAADVEAAQIDTHWVHVAPLVRTDFPPAALAALNPGERKIAYDGQGLVRPARLGPVGLDADYDPHVLDFVTVLKLSEREAHLLAGGTFDAHTAARLGVPEILVTRGEQGCDLYTDGHLTQMAANPVADAQPTGAGDIFMVVYVARRAAGATPVQAARDACELVPAILAQRPTTSPWPAKQWAAHTQPH